jgi:hypothetical protein
MTAARPLRDVFADLAGAQGTTDPADLLRGQGHFALPDDLVAEAVVSYADTAPVEVAEHLAPYVSAHSVVGADPGDDAPADWVDLLGSAPEVLGDEPADFDDEVSAPQWFDDAHPGAALDFGSGAELETDDDVDDDLPVEFPDDSADVPDWTPVEPHADADLHTVDLTADEFDDDGEPADDPLD